MNNEVCVFEGRRVVAVLSVTPSEVMMSEWRMKIAQKMSSLFI